VTSNIAGTVFTLVTAGTYEVTFQVSVDEPGQLEITLDNAILPWTVVGRATGTSQIQETALVTAAAGDTLSVLNPAGNAAALTVTPIAGGASTVSASVTFVLL
jgi:hypothetical protein